MSEASRLTKSGQPTNMGRTLTFWQYIGRDAVNATPRRSMPIAKLEAKLEDYLKGTPPPEW